jgi:DNA-binding Lrp family transcriptional regulator
MVTAKDRELIGLLKVNAREPVTSLARKLGLSRSTVQDRLRRLEAEGTIAGYSVRLGEDAGQDGIRSWVTVAIAPGRAAEVSRALVRLPQIEMLHTVSGKFDIVALVRARSAEEMDKLLDHVGLIPGVTRTESAVILSTKLDRR